MSVLGAARASGLVNPPSGTTRALPAHGGARGSRALRRRLTEIAWWIAVLLVSVCTVLPLLWTIATSLKPAGEILSAGFRILPREWTFENYTTVFQTVPMVRYALNSLVLAAAGVLTNLFFGSLAGYTLAKLRVPGKRLIFAAYVGSMMIPSAVTMVPLFLILRHFPLAGGNTVSGSGGTGFINSYWAVILPGAVGAFAVFFMKQFFQTLSDDVGDAARIDGASEFRIFLRIYFPMARASLAVLGVLTFQAGWNDFMWPLIVLNDPQKLTIQVGLAGFINNYNAEYGPLMAGTVMATIPVLVVFVVAQRWIIDSSGPDRHGRRQHRGVGTVDRTAADAPPASSDG